MDSCIGRSKICGEKKYTVRMRLFGKLNLRPIIKSEYNICACKADTTYSYGICLCFADMMPLGSLLSIRNLYFRAFFCTSHPTVYAIKLKREAMYFLCPFFG